MLRGRLLSLYTVTSQVVPAAGGLGAGLLLWLCGVWALRLGTHLFIRWRAHGEDPRYARMLGKAKERGAYAGAALTNAMGR